ncbi:Isoleucyl-tRNA synthetase, partial [hydrothermal vent metagenome]
PFIRTKETAKIIKDKLGIDSADIVYDNRLKELWAGDFEGASVDEYRKFAGSSLQRFTNRPNGGETAYDIKRRTTELLYEVESKYANKNILFITHSMPAWLMMAGAQGATPEEAVNFWEGDKDEVAVGSVRKIEFIPLPHNEEYELDLHRPYIDEIMFTCACGGVMKRIPDVFDCWVESGSMPFAQFHYPFENKDEFKNNFPADFIAEGIDQTRGWFYTSLVMSAALFGKSPYENVIVNGLVMAEDGKKMSKRLKNYPEPWEILNKYSADALRYYMLSAPIVHGEEMRFSEKGVDEVQKKVIGRILNVLSFYKLYEDTNVSAGNDSKNVLDEWIVARLYQMTEEIEESLDKYELDR